MSVVTGLVLMCSLLDGEAPTGGFELSDNIKHLNSWLMDRGFRPLKNVAHDSGGSTHPQCMTFHCGYNHFPEDAFAAQVLSLEWGDPENVILVMQPEEGATRVFSGPHFEDRNIREALLASLKSI